MPYPWPQHIVFKAVKPTSRRERNDLIVSFEDCSDKAAQEGRVKHTKAEMHARLDEMVEKVRKQIDERTG